MKPELREQSGLDQPVADYLAAQPDVEEMFQDISSYLLKWLPRLLPAIAPTSRSALAVQAGITARFYLTERLGKCLQEALKNVQVRHRDLT